MADRNDACAARLIELHARLLDGDRGALALIFEELWRPLCRRLRWQFSRAPADLVTDAASDAIGVYTERPQAFDSARHVPLDVFVYGIAWRKLRDQLRAEGRRSQREAAVACILPPHAHCPGDRVITPVLLREIRSLLPLVCTPTELRAMMAWLDEDDTALAGALSLSQAAKADQELSNKRLVARTVKRLQRLLKVCGTGGANAPTETTKKVNG